MPVAKASNRRGRGDESREEALPKGVRKGTGCGQYEVPEKASAKAALSKADGMAMPARRGKAGHRVRRSAG